MRAATPDGCADDAGGDNDRADDDEADDDEGPAGRAERVGVLLSVDPDRVGDVLRASAGAGLEDAEPLAAAGVITGRIRADRVETLQGLPGVEAVEVERTLQVPPSASPLQ